MNDIQENHLNRAQKVLLFLNEHAAEIASTPDLVATLTPELDTRINKVNTDAPLADVDNTGYGATKDGFRETLNTNVFHVGSGLISYADDHDDLVLLHMIDFPISTIQKFRDNRILGYSKLVLDKANVPAVAAELATNHNVSLADRTALGTARTNYADYIGQPLEKRDERSGYTKLVTRDFEDLNETIDRIRRKMNVYYTTNRTLWEIYDAADHIDDTGSTSGNQSLVGNIGAGAEQKLFDIVYAGAKALDLENTGSVPIEFSIRQDGAAPPVSTPTTVMPGNTLNTTMGFLAGSGNELWVKNPGGASGSFGVVVHA